MARENPTPATQGPLLADRTRGLRLAELLLFFFALPAGLILVRAHLRLLVVPLVVVGGTAAALVLARDPAFDWRARLSVRTLRQNLPHILLVFLLPACLLAAAVYRFDRPAFLSFPRTHFWFWLVVMLFYPLVGATLQEVLFRVFWFHRYERLFSDPRMLLLANAAGFAMFHLFYANPIAPTLSFLGGLLFAHRYRRTRSLLAVSWEHGLWGAFLFTIGLGQYFFSGHIG